MNKKSILVVDDDSFNRQIVVDMLMSVELYTVMSATDGHLGCQLAERFQPNLILMDWNMPGLSGYEAVQQLQSNEKTKEIPVIVVTGANNKAELDSMSNIQLAGHVTKPVVESELLKCVDSTLNN